MIDRRRPPLELLLEELGTTQVPDDLATEVAHAVLTQVGLGERRPRLRIAISAGAAAAAFVVGLLLFLLAGLPLGPAEPSPPNGTGATPRLTSGHPTPTAKPAATTTAAAPGPTTPSPAASFGPGAAAVASIPVDVRRTRGQLAGRFSASGVWTGSEVIIWGGWEDGRTAAEYRADGAAYDPRSDRWRPIPEAPVAGRAGHLAVWNGSEMLIWGGTHEGDLTDGAAYDPATDSWRTIARSPLDWSPKPAATWRGSDWIIATATPDDVFHIAAYDPAADAWRSLPSLEGAFDGETHLAWTGSELVVLNSTTGLHRLAEGAAAWVGAAPGPSGMPILGPITWTGEQLLGRAFHYRGPGTSAWMFLAAWDPASDSWQALAQPPRTLDGPLLWTGDRVVAPDAELAFDIESQEWWQVPLPPAAAHSDGVVLWIDEALFMWGGGPDVHAAPVDDGVVATAHWSAAAPGQPPGAACPAFEPEFVPDDLVSIEDRHNDGMSLRSWFSEDWSADSDPHGRSVSVGTGWGEPAEQADATGRYVTLLGQSVEVFYHQPGDTQIAFQQLNEPELSTCIWLVVAADGLSQDEFRQVVESVVEK